MEVGATDSRSRDANHYIGVVDDRGSGHVHDGHIVGRATVNDTLHGAEGHGSICEAKGNRDQLKVEINV